MRVRRRAGLGLAAGLVLVAIALGGNRERAGAAERLRLARPLRTIVIAHLPDRVRTFARVDVSRLRCGAACGVATRTISSRTARARISASLERVRASTSTSGFDARWLVSVTDANGTMTTFACDRFGRMGAVDGRPVALLETSGLLSALRRELPADER